MTDIEIWFLAVTVLAVIHLTFRVNWLEGDMKRIKSEQIRKDLGNNSETEKDDMKLTIELDAKELTEIVKEHIERKHGIKVQSVAMVDGDSDTIDVWAQATVDTLPVAKTN